MLIARLKFLEALAVKSAAVVMILAVVGTVVPASARAADDILLAPPGFCGTAETNRNAAYPAQKKAILCLINEARSRAGVQTLQHSPCETGSQVTTCTTPRPTNPRTARIYGAAYKKVADVTNCQQPDPPATWVHTACGRPMNYWITQFDYGAGCPGWAWGENIYNGWGGGANPRSAVAWWLQSPGHRANMLNPQWTEQGVTFTKADFQGHTEGENWVSLFGRCG